MTGEAGAGGARPDAPAAPSRGRAALGRPPAAATRPGTGATARGHGRDSPGGTGATAQGHGAAWCRSQSRAAPRPVPPQPGGTGPPGATLAGAAPRPVLLSDPCRSLPAAAPPRCRSQSGAARPSVAPCPVSLPARCHPSPVLGLPSSPRRQPLGEGRECPGRIPSEPGDRPGAVTAHPRTDTTVLQGRA